MATVDKRPSITVDDTLNKLDARRMSTKRRSLFKVSYFVFHRLSCATLLSIAVGHNRMCGTANARLPCAFAKNKPTTWCRRLGNRGCLRELCCDPADLVLIRFHCTQISQGVIDPTNAEQMQEYTKRVHAQYSKTHRDLFSEIWDKCTLASVCVYAHTAVVHLTRLLADDINKDGVMSQKECFALVKDALEASKRIMPQQLEDVIVNMLLIPLPKPIGRLLTSVDSLSDWLVTRRYVAANFRRCYVQGHPCQGAPSTHCANDPGFRFEAVSPSRRAG